MVRGNEQATVGDDRWALTPDDSCRRWVGPNLRPHSQEKGGQKWEGRGGWDKNEEVKSAEERDMHEVLVGARRGMACWCSCWGHSPPLRAFDGTSRA